MAEHLRPDRLVPFFAATAGEVVGTHDGSRSTIHVGALDDEVVYHHEYGHEALFTRTVDGAILSILWRVMDEPAAVAPDRLSQLSTTAKTLVTGSVDAQEIFATYYGIKLVEPEIGNRYIDRLPEDYKAYFTEAAEVIDPLFGSTYMQVRVALNLAHLAFESRFVLRFLRNPLAAYKSQHAEEKPSWRLRALLDYVASNGDAFRQTLLDAAKTFFNRQQSAPWDLDEEAAWVAAGAQSNLLDLELDQCADAWLRGRNVVPVLGKDERAACTKRLATFANRLGVALLQGKGVPSDLPDILGLDSTLARMRHDEATRTHAWRQAGSFISNTTIGRGLPAARGAALWEIDDYRLADRLVVIAGDPPTLPDLWTVLRSGPAGASTNLNLNGTRVHGVHFHRDDVIEWLNRLLPGQGWTGRQPDMILAAIGSDSKAGERAFSYRPNREPGRIDSWHNDRLFLYVMGNWFDFIESAAQVGQVQLTQIAVDLTGHGEQAQPMFLKFARCSGFAGPCFLRALAAPAAAAATLLELDWRGNSAIQSVEIEEFFPGDAADDLVALALSAILAFWSRI